MGRHAGYAAAITVGEDYLNQTLWAALEDASIDPLIESRFIVLPGAVPLVGGQTVRLTGVVLFDQRPTISLATNPSNTLRVTTSAVLFAAGSLNPGSPAELDETWVLRLSGAADVAVDVELDDPTNGIYLRWNPATSSILGLTITLQQGPSVPPWLQSALNSPTVLAAFNTALRRNPPVRITGRLFSRSIVHTQPATFERTGFSVFEWFSIRERISKADLRVADGAINLGIDLAGLSSGNPGGLVNLLQQVGTGPVYRWVTTDSTLPGDRPVLEGRGARTSTGDISVLFNPDVLAAIVNKVSARISGTPIAPKIKVVSVATRVAQFDKPLRGRETGLCIDFVVDHQDIGAVAGRAYLQPYVTVDGEPGPTPRPPAWMLYVGHVEIDVPWWVEFAIALAGIALAVTLPVLSPLVAVGLIAVFDGILPGVIGDAESASQRSLGRGTTISRGVTTSTTSPTPHRRYQSLERIQVSDDGLGLRLSDNIPDVRFRPTTQPLVLGGVGVSLDAGSPEPFIASIGLNDLLASLTRQCTVRLVVRRSDTGDEVARLEGPYATSTQVSWDHMTADLFLVDSYDIVGQIFLSGPSMTGLLFSQSVTASVSDYFDRHHSFVRWGAHWAHFRNVGTGGEWWHRYSQPKVHRTAPSARCLALRQLVSRYAASPFQPALFYSDSLDYAWDDLAMHRDELCDYCFFGGPTRQLELPRDDWFVR
jgi:hypothetical protein